MYFFQFIFPLEKNMALMDVPEEMRQEIPSMLQLVTINAHKYQSHLKKYSYLWMDDKTEFMKLFLIHGQFLAAEELELVCILSVLAPHCSKHTLKNRH